MTRRRELTQKEERMWGRVVRSVRAIPESERRSPDIDPPFQQPLHTPEKAEEKSVFIRPRATPTDLEKLLGGYAEPVRSGNFNPEVTKNQIPSGRPADRGQEKRIRRGKFPIGPTLDLHGHTQETGRRALQAFVTLQRSLGETTVIIVTGKGRAGGGILRTRFLDWIAETDLRSHISGYSIANQKHGGDGAYYLFLKRVVR